MASVLVRDLPEEVVAALRRRAARHDRSLQKELKRILQQAAEEATRAEPLPPIRLQMSKAPARGTYRREEIYGDDGR